MRKIALVAAAAALALVACGDSKSSDSADTTVPADSGATQTSVDAPATTAAESTVATSSTVPTPTRPPVPKPSVKIPATAPTELKITVLKEGTGDGAANGDQVVVHYVGVRSKDGVEFDNSYDRGQPFTVSLGAGSVIKGWDQGLVGAKASSQIQLDVPSALAYGDQPQGDKIGANENLSFVIDVLAVVKKVDPKLEPVLVIPPSSSTAVTTVDLIVGTGPESVAGGTVTFHYQFYRGDTGAKVFSSWTGTPASIPLVPDGQLDGLIKGLTGMKVGGRRQITVPGAQAFGGQGNPSLSIPPGVDIILVADLLAAY